MSTCMCMGPIPGTNVCQCGRVFRDSTVNIGIASYTPDWNKAWTDFVGETQDVTSDCLKAVIEKIGTDDAHVVMLDGKPAFEISIRKLGGGV